MFKILLVPMVAALGLAAAVSAKAPPAANPGQGTASVAPKSHKPSASRCPGTAARTVRAYPPGPSKPGNDLPAPYCPEPYFNTLARR